MPLVEGKVKASTAAAAVSGLALWALGNYVFKGSVPDVVASWTYVIVPAVITFAAGYLAKHTPRTAPAPVITVSTTATQPANIGRQGSPEKTLLPPGVPESGPPMSSLPPAAQQTLLSPAAPVTEQPPGAAGPEA